MLCNRRTQTLQVNR